MMKSQLTETLKIVYENIMLLTDYKQNIKLCNKHNFNLS